MSGIITAISSGTVSKVANIDVPSLPFSQRLLKAAPLSSAAFSQTRIRMTSTCPVATNALLESRLTGLLRRALRPILRFPEIPGLIPAVDGSSDNSR